jgi:hypothetical protein
MPPIPKRTSHHEGHEEHEVKTKAVQNEDCKLQKSKWLTIRGLSPINLHFSICNLQFAFKNILLAFAHFVVRYSIFHISLFTDESDSVRCLPKSASSVSVKYPAARECRSRCRERSILRRWLETITTMIARQDFRWLA